MKQGDRIKLSVPDKDKEPMKSRVRHSSLHGEHLAYHGRVGIVLCLAGNGGAWVHFDGQQPTEYIGCPIAWLEPA